MIVNQFNIIEAANEMTEKIFGIDNNGNTSFKNGRIEKDDIVILIIDNFKNDENVLNIEDLGFLGIRDINIEKESGIIAVGCYKNEEIEPIFKVLKNGHDDVINMKTYFLGLGIIIDLDKSNNKLDIRIGSDTHECTYSAELNKMVIVSGSDNKIKYYSPDADFNDARDILHGEEFKEETDIFYEPSIINRYTLEALPDNCIIEKITDAIKNNNFKNDEGTVLINNYLVHYWIYKIKEKDEDFRVILKMKNITAEYNDAVKWIDQADSNRLNFKYRYQNDYIERFREFLGSCSEIMNVKYMAYRASLSNSTVIIYGESGTGKSLLARCIHKNGRCPDMPFIEVNCASIPESLAESEFFGYEKGAFTGAVNNGKKGFFELAQNGTIFLDEIGELTLSMQAKLLGVIQNRCFYKVGGTKKIDVNIRIISATNKDLKKLINEGKFREDLYYRINVLPIRIPSLRERRPDIRDLAEKLLKDICGRLNSDIKIISGSAMIKLINYKWPGNIRELENVLEAAINICHKNIILPEDLLINDEICEDDSSLKKRLEYYEKKILTEKLIEYNNDKNKIMESLKISRSSLFEKISKYNINVQNSGLNP